MMIFVLLSPNSVVGPQVGSYQASVTNQDERAFIQFHILFSTPASKVYGMFIRVARRNTSSMSQICKLYKEFKKGSRLSCEDAPNEVLYFHRHKS